MTYYVYENYRVNPDKAIIHYGNCGHCKNGHGQSGKGTKPQNGKWHGPCLCRANTFQFAHALGRTRVEPCGHCRP